MELALAFGLAIASFLAVSAWASRGVERARARRLVEEMRALRRPDPAALRLVEREPSAGVITADTPADAGHDAAPANPDPVLVEVRGALEEALTLVRSAVAETATAGPRAPGPVERLRREARDFLSAAERSAERIAELLGRAEPFTAPAAGNEPPPPSSDETVAGTDESLALADAAADELFDAAARLADDLGAVARGADRIEESSRRTGSVLGAVERGAETLLPYTSALSSVANRINLLALNVAVHAGPDGKGGTFQEAGNELRSLFEETRRLSRELGSAAQRAADAARAAQEVARDLTAVAADGRGRAERLLQHLRKLEGGRLRDALDGARRAVSQADETRRRARQADAVGAAREAAFRAEERAHREELVAWLGELRSAAEALFDVRTAGARSVGDLLAHLEAADAEGPRRDDLLGRLRAAERALNALPS